METSVITSTQYKGKEVGCVALFIYNFSEELPAPDVL